MKKAYDYSVKDLLTRHYGEDAILNMRAPHSEFGTDESFLLPLAWAKADWLAVSECRGELFLEQTVLYDDYIAYFARAGRQRLVFLCFMVFSDELPEKPNPAYAAKLVAEWTQKGRRAVILRCCVRPDRFPDGDFVMRVADHNAFLQPVTVGETPLFKRMVAPYWEHATALLYDAITGGCLTDYECLLAENAKLLHGERGSIERVARGDYQHTELLAEGIAAIRHYFDRRRNACELVYYKEKAEAGFTATVVAPGVQYQLLCDRSNQIAAIVEEERGYGAAVYPLPPHQRPRRAPMPRITAVRALNVAQQYAYAVQITCEDGCVKNYCLKAIDQIPMPDEVEIGGYIFNESLLRSARRNEADPPGVVFANGYTLPAHLLYYRGRSQVTVKREPIPGVVFANDSVRVEGCYREPATSSFWGDGGWVRRPDEIGSGTIVYSDEALPEGKPPSPTGGGAGEPAAKAACRCLKRCAANGKFGYLNEDGSWLVPPVFDEAEEFQKTEIAEMAAQCVKAKIGSQQFLVTWQGERIPFAYEIDTRDFYLGLCPFCAKPFEGQVPTPVADGFDELTPGLWGYINADGQIVVPPQYVYATNFGMWGHPRAFVAKLVDGALQWGLLGPDGREVVACQYAVLEGDFGPAVHFMREQNGLYGLLDLNGKVMLEPRYEIIWAYHQALGLIGAGAREQIGVVEIKSGRVIVPCRYHSVFMIEGEDDYITCETGDGDEVYFTYDGTPLPQKAVGAAQKYEDGLVVWQNGKCGFTDKAGRVVLPFVYDQAKFIEYDFAGFCVTGKAGRYGLTTKEGKRLLPETYSDVTLLGDWIVASKSVNGNGSYADELYWKDGAKVFEGLSRDIEIDGDAITRQTPFGKEVYRIVQSAASRAAAKRKKGL